MYEKLITLIDGFNAIKLGNLSTGNQFAFKYQNIVFKYIICF